MIRSTFFLPVLLALLSLAGLVIALTGEGWRDLVSSAALLTPVAAVIWAMARSSSHKETTK